MKAKAYIVHRAMCEPELEWSKPKDCLSADPLYTTPPQRKPHDDKRILNRIVREDTEIQEGTWSLRYHVHVVTEPLKPPTALRSRT